MAGLFYDRSKRRIGPLLRGHLLLFDQAVSPAFSASSGLRLLLIFVVLEFVLGPRAGFLAWFHIAPPPTLLRISLMLALAWLSAVSLAAVHSSDIGFLPFSRWSTTERFYIAQAPLPIVVFVALESAPSKLLAGASAGWSVLAVVVASQLLWGLYQEVVYRGMLQSELTRRWGPWIGPIVANVAFTFGPLHFYHLERASLAHSAAAWESAGMILGATFAIGLLFAFIFHRTHNIWLVGMLHGIGDMFIEGPAMISELSK